MNSSLHQIISLIISLISDRITLYDCTNIHGNSETEERNFWNPFSNRKTILSRIFNTIAQEKGKFEILPLFLLNPLGIPGSRGWKTRRWRVKRIVKKVISTDTAITTLSTA